MKSKQTKACDISSLTKKLVWERDAHICVVCHSPYAAPNAHYIRRSRGGLGIPENIVSLCGECHRKYDNGTEHEQTWYKCFLEAYLKSIYPGWNEEKLIYKKWSE